MIERPSATLRPRTVEYSSSVKPGKRRPARGRGGSCLSETPAKLACLGFTNRLLGIERLDHPARSDVAVVCNRRDCCAVHEPCADVAAAIRPENVARSIAIEVAGLSDSPIERHVANYAGRRNLAAVHQPHADITLTVAPENVIGPIARKIANTGDRPIEWHHAEVHRFCN